MNYENQLFSYSIIQLLIFRTPYPLKVLFAFAVIAGLTRNPQALLPEIIKNLILTLFV